MNKTTVIFSLGALIASVFVFAWFHNWIIIIIPARQQNYLMAHLPQARLCKKKVVLFLPQKNLLSEETKEIVYSLEEKNLIAVVAQAWLNQAYEEQLIHQPIKVQSGALSFNKDELILSFDGVPFTNQAAIIDKIIIIEALIKTMHFACPHIQKIHLLCNHSPWLDDQLDFTFPWPVDPFFSVQETTSPKPLGLIPREIKTIVIHPFGDTKQTGRTVHNGFERTYTLEYALSIKKYIEQEVPAVRVLITRSPGTQITQQQAAELANKLHADLYIELFCYGSSAHFLSCSLFYLRFQPEQDWLKYNKPSQSSPLALLPVREAHLAQTKTSKHIAQFLNQNIKKVLENSLEVASTGMGIPLMGLTGVTCPACALEIGIPKNVDHIILSKTVAQSIVKLIKPILD